jgi:hypothetical protein
MADAKEHAHQLIDRLPPAQLSAVVGLLEAMLDPVSLAIANAPIDDEPLTPEEEKALGEAREGSMSSIARKLTADARRVPVLHLGF